MACAKAELSSTQLWAEISTFTFTVTFQMLFRLAPKPYAAVPVSFALTVVLYEYLHLPLLGFIARGPTPSYLTSLFVPSLRFHICFQPEYITTDASS